MDATSEQAQTWRVMYDRLCTRAEKYNCKDYTQCLQLLDLSMDVPTLAQVNSKLQSLTDWTIIPNGTNFSETGEWFEHILRKEFLVTEYLRNWDELDFTPRPDMFHDIFGHVIYLLMPAHAELQDMFAKAYFSVPENKRICVERLYWYSVESGLIRENDGIRIYGGALASSEKESAHIMAGHVPIEPFIGEQVMELPLPWMNDPDDGYGKNVAENNTLFVFDSLADLKAELKKTFKLLEKSHHDLAVA